MTRIKEFLKGIFLPLRDRSNSDILWDQLPWRRFCALRVLLVFAIRFIRRDASICIARISYGNVAGWLAGWLSVTAGIVSKRIKLS